MKKAKLLRGTAAVCLAAALLSIPASAATMGTGTVKADSLNLRASASASSASLGLLSGGTSLVVEESSGDWYKVWAGGEEGYVKSEYVSFATGGAWSGTGKISTTDVRFRSGPSTSSNILGTYGTGTALTVTGIEGDWVKCVISGTEGYVKSDFVTFTSSSSGKEAGTDQGWINTTDVRFRSGPSTSSAILGVYGTGTQLSVLGSDSGWVKCTINGVTGYVRADFVSSTEVVAPSAASSLGQQIADYAQNYLGCAYAWGATGPSSFDCSGLTTYVYRHFGYTLQRTAQNQFNSNGTPVDKSSLQPGDLVFFGSGSYVGHVGIYIGDGKFIHASTYGVGVIISSLSESYYTSRYQGARRIVS